MCHLSCNMTRMTVRDIQTLRAVNRFDPRAQIVEERLWTVAHNYLESYAPDDVLPCLCDACYQSALKNCPEERTYEDELSFPRHSQLLLNRQRRAAIQEISDVSPDAVARDTKLLTEIVALLRVLAMKPSGPGYSSDLHALKQHFVGRQ